MTLRNANAVLEEIPTPSMPRRHSTIWKKIAYGRNANAVRKQLVPANIFGVETYIHKKAMPRVDAWIKDVRAYEKRRGIPHWHPKVVQVFNWRHMRNDPSAPLSNHSWAGAFDIDPKTNAATYRVSTSKTDIPWYVFRYAEANGIRIGLRFGDPMHFEALY